MRKHLWEDLQRQLPRCMPSINKKSSPKETYFDEGNFTLKSCSIKLCKQYAHGKIPSNLSWRCKKAKHTFSSPNEPNDEKVYRMAVMVNWFWSFQVGDQDRQIRICGILSKVLGNLGKRQYASKLPQDFAHLCAPFGHSPRLPQKSLRAQLQKPQILICLSYWRRKVITSDIV